MQDTAFDFMWELLNPSPQYNDRKDKCRALFNALHINRQRLMYRTYRDKKREGLTIPENPYFAISNFEVPEPTNYNGTANAARMLDQGKVIPAWYNGQCGLYTKEDVQLYGMTPR